MKIFISHARKDYRLARQLADPLTRMGFKVWISEDEIVPGDNWAKQVGKALDSTQLMVFLFTPEAQASDTVSQDVELAIGSKKFKDRVFTVFVGPAPKMRKEVPWILLLLPHRQMESAKAFGDVAKEIQSLYAPIPA